MMRLIDRLKYVSISEKHELFLKKLRLCCVVFDFVAEPQLKEKEIKRQTLLEVVDYVISSESVIQEATKIVSTNLFSNQQWTNNKTPKAGDLEKAEEGSLNPSWPHLQIGKLYHQLINLIISYKTISEHMSSSFMSQNAVNNPETHGQQLHCAFQEFDPSINIAPDFHGQKLSHLDITSQLDYHLSEVRQEFNNIPSVKLDVSDESEFTTPSSVRVPPSAFLGPKCAL
ncbi:unnamed protein product [Eruca vesicaria subsp. sativa]|uniref:Uncharacterized protein n=1 Tax=Eruca vesicaria subsp. sativa TaxID=29727 RepID=A0ABC8LNM0_ERUVS|nr:unnamed protein product [Eruca vesicaria subsp. sativa]